VHCAVKNTSTPTDVSHTINPKLGYLGRLRGVLRKGKAGGNGRDRGGYKGQKEVTGRGGGKGRRECVKE